MKKLSRRNLLAGSASLVGLAASQKLLGQNLCLPTPKQVEGPFYPIHKQLDTDTDLTHLQGSGTVADGDMLYLAGEVLGEDCLPLSGVLVEIWQACATGRYNHPSDPNTAKLDPHFQYWGEAITNAQGEYLFKTIIPGAYPASATWMRPPHIHVKVSKLGYHELISQIYFDRFAQLNSQDLILNQLPQADQDKLIVPLNPPDASMEPSAVKGFFSITLKKV